jgi:DNA-binding NarL/FixJ family response regulator
MTMTVLIVDDHEEFRSFARILLDADGFEVTGEAEDGESALDQVQRLQPDVVLLDVQLGDGIDGFEVARRLADGTEGPADGTEGPKVVLISSREAADYGTRLKESPVSGFISKRELSGDAINELISQN